MRSTDVVIIGAGAAGLMCALTAAATRPPGAADRARQQGGQEDPHVRWWALQLHQPVHGPGQLLLAEPAFLQVSSGALHPVGLRRHGQQARRARSTRRSSGQLFCDNKSKDILDMLLDECQQAGVDLRLDTSVQQIEKTEAGYVLSTDIGAVASPSLVVATGGLSIPTLGATGFGYEIARQFGHTVLATRAGLVPFTSPTSSRTCAPSCPARRWPASSAATARVSARTSCSPTAASVARRSCRSPRSGTPATPWRSTCCPTATPWSGCKASSPRAPTAS